MKIKSVWDNGGITIDRFAIVLDDGSECVSVSSNSEHPQGFSQWSECEEGEHLGKQITFNDLPENVQKHVMSRI